MNELPKFGWFKVINAGTSLLCHYYCVEDVSWCLEVFLKIFYAHRLHIQLTDAEDKPYIYFLTYYMKCTKEMNVKVVQNMRLILQKRQTGWLPDPRIVPYPMGESLGRETNLMLCCMSIISHPVARYTFKLFQTIPDQVEQIILPTQAH